MPFVRVFVAALLCLLSFSVLAQSFPAKPLRLVLRAPPGGTDDLLGRLLALKMGEALGQQIVVDYRTGAGGLIAWEYIAKSPPDGYTSLLAASGLGAVRSLRPKATIDPWRDFEWVSQVVNYQLALVVHPTVPAKNLKELIALARKMPGKLSYGSSGVGATPHLSAEYFKALAKVDILHVPYKGAGPMLLDLLSGRIEMGATVVATAIPHAKAGKVRILGTSGSKRVPQIPGVPTIGETVPGYAFDAYYALLVPGGTPQPIVGRLADAAAKAVASPEYRQRVIERGMEPVSSTPEKMVEIAKIDAAKIEKIVRTANIKIE